MNKDELVEWIRYLYSIDQIEKFYKGRHFRALRKQVLKEQHYECQMCKEKGKLTIVKPSRKRSGVIHHVKEVKDYPELALSKYYTDKYGMKQRQLIVLCNDCHELVHKRMIRAEYKPQLNEERW